MLTTDGRVFSWGGLTDCLGRGENNDSLGIDEVRFSALKDVVIVKLAAGRNHILALDSNNRVWTWGSNENG